MHNGYGKGEVLLVLTVVVVVHMSAPTHAWRTKNDLQASMSRYRAGKSLLHHVLSLTFVMMLSYYPRFW